MNRRSLMQQAAEPAQKQPAAQQEIEPARQQPVMQREVEPERQQTMMRPSLIAVAADDSMLLRGSTCPPNAA